MSDIKTLVKIFAAAFLLLLFISFTASKTEESTERAWALTEVQEIPRKVHKENNKFVEATIGGTVFKFIPEKELKQIDKLTWKYIYPASNKDIKDVINAVNEILDPNLKITNHGTILLSLALRDGLPVKVNLPVCKLLATSSMPVYNDPGSSNMLLAANAINGTVIPPGGEFSFNKVVGPRTAERGYVESLSIYGDNWVPDIGGGVCRTSTLLHHAVLKACLKVTERNSHGLPVSYAAPGEDATVAWGELDYRFINTTDKNIIIKIKVENGRLDILLFQEE
jgi:hypothetical protein